MNQPQQWCGNVAVALQFIPQTDRCNFTEQWPERKVYLCTRLGFAMDIYLSGKPRRDNPIAPPSPPSAAFLASTYSLLGPNADDVDLSTSTGPTLSSPLCLLQSPNRHPAPNPFG